MKFQNKVLPKGMTGNLTGPYEGRRQGSLMSAESSLLAQLQQHAWFGNRPLRINGDHTYHHSIHLQTPFRGAHFKTLQRSHGFCQSICRLVKNYFKLIDFKQMQRIGMSPVGKVFVVCVLLQNTNISLYCNTISETFNREPPNI